MVKNKEKYKFLAEILKKYKKDACIFQNFLLE